MFDESLLLEESEDWDLFGEIAACYQSKTKMDILECYRNDPLNSIDSACRLSSARDRCSSEPSVCLGSRPPPADHEPVARQSSCDATIIHNQFDYLNQLRQLQLESQKLLNESMKTNHQALWRSTQASTTVKEKNLQKASPSNRSSFSSLSSTTTSPSASSLSSLDSTFSYCSESSLFSHNDVTSLPFMFGTSARLHTLSPEITKKKLKEWHIPLSTLFGGNICDLDSWEMQWEAKMDDKINSKDTVQIDSDKGEESCQKLNYNVQAKDSVLFSKESRFEGSHGRAEAGQENGHCSHKETSVKHIEIRRPESSKDGGLQHTKVTCFMSPNVVPLKNLNDQNLSEDSSNSCSKSTKLQIPQTVFYGQNAPLVLHSVSRRQQPEMEKPYWQTQLKHVFNSNSTKDPVTEDKSEAVSSLVIDNETINKEQNIEDPKSEETTNVTALSKSHSKAIASFTQTIRITLPSSVKNTVREYFKHSDPKSISQTVTVESNLTQGKAESCSLQGTAAARDTKGCLVGDSIL